MNYFLICSEKMFKLCISLQDLLSSYYQNQKVLPTSESLSELRPSGFGSGSKLSTISESSASQQQQQQQKNLGLDIEYLLNQTTSSGARTGHLVITYYRWRHWCFLL